METNQESKSCNPSADWRFMVHPGNILWMGILPVDRLALGSIEQNRCPCFAGFLYKLSSATVNRNLPIRKMDRFPDPDVLFPCPFGLSVHKLIQKTG